jgi:hypothetical protein
MSYRAGSSGFAFLASWRTGAGNNFCPSVGSSYRAVRSNLPRRMEIARQSRLQLGVARAAAAPWCSSRNLPLNRSAGGLLTGRISLTVRNRFSVSKLPRASARTLHVCVDRRGHFAFEAKREPCNLPAILIRPSWPQDSRFSTHRSRKPAVPKAAKSIPHP